METEGHSQVLRRSERIKKLREVQPDARDTVDKSVSKISSTQNLRKGTTKGRSSTLQGKTSRRVSHSTPVAKTLKRKASDTKSVSPERKKVAPTKNQKTRREKKPVKDLEEEKQTQPQETNVIGVPKARHAVRLMPRNERIKALHNAINRLPEEGAFYSDPRKFVDLPFPFTLNPRDSNITNYRRDDISFFPFMGRKVFADVLQWYRRYSNGDDVARKLALYGPSGSGKTSILTALACLLIRKGCHVIYVPSCHLLVADFISHMMAALYFAIPEDLHSAVDASFEAEDIISLVNDFKKDHFVFILPDWDAFLPQRNDIVARERASTLELIERIVCNHGTICSFSWSCENSCILNSKELGLDIIYQEGGFSDEEMEFWWQHNAETLPLNISVDDREKIQYYTGRLPSLLRGLSALSGRVFSEAESDYWESDSMSSFRTSIQRKIEEKFRSLSGDEIATRSFIEETKVCLQEIKSDPSVDQQSHSYEESLFYFDSGIGRCLTGDAREIATVTIMKRIPTFLDDDSWVTLMQRTTNPFIKKFFLAQVCLARISSRGLEILDDRLKQMPFKYYNDTPQWSAAIFQEEAESATELRYLFISPRTLNSSIDGIAFYFNREENVLELFFFQIAPSRDIECVDETFYSLRWKSLRESLAKMPITHSYELRSTYVFLHCGASEGTVQVQKTVIINRRKVEYRLCKLSCSAVSDGLGAI